MAYRENFSYIRTPEALDIVARADQICMDKLRGLVERGIITPGGLAGAQQSQFDEYVVLYASYRQESDPPSDDDLYVRRKIKQLFLGPEEKAAALEGQPTREETIDAVRDLLLLIQETKPYENADLLTGFLIFGSRMSSVKTPERPVIEGEIVVRPGSDIDIMAVATRWTEGKGHHDPFEAGRWANKSLQSRRPEFKGIDIECFFGLDIVEFRTAIEDSVPPISLLITPDVYFVGSLPAIEKTVSGDLIHFPALEEAQVNDKLQAALSSEAAINHRQRVLYDRKSSMVRGMG